MTGLGDLGNKSTVYSHEVINIFSRECLSLWAKMLHRKKCEGKGVNITPERRPSTSASPGNL